MFWLADTLSLNEKMSVLPMSELVLWITYILWNVCCVLMWHFLWIINIFSVFWVFVFWWTMIKSLSVNYRLSVCPLSNVVLSAQYIFVCLFVFEMIYLFVCVWNDTFVCLCLKYFFTEMCFIVKIRVWHAAVSSKMLSG